jgi:hypothetical protein
MTSRDLTVAGFLVLAALALLLFVLGHVRRLGLTPLGGLVDRIRTSTAGRFLLALSWAWVGWHLLAR